MFAYFDGRWDDAVALYQRAGEASERAGTPAVTAYTDCNVGEILSDQGHLDEAEDHLRRARRVWSGTGEGQAVAYIDVLLGRLSVRRGDYGDGLLILQDAMAELRRQRRDAYAEFALALIAEAEAFGGDALRALDIASTELRANDRMRPLLTRVAGIAFARLGEKAGATRELRHSLESARKSGADYDIAATIDALEALGAADQQLLRSRDQITRRLRIRRQLPSLARA
jgi:tetratricopeptide (TPR) repeat protein